jgi:TRAP-type C4-dicarboxylate transport system permease small subunit
MRRLLDRLAALSLALAALSLVGMALVQAWQVFARYVLNDAPGWTEPLALILMSFAVMFGAAVGVRAETHFAFQTLQHALSAPVQKGLRAVSRLIAAATGAGLFFYGGFLMLDDWGVSMPGAPLPAGSRFLALTIGGALIFIFAVERLVSPEAQSEEGE